MTARFLAGSAAAALLALLLQLGTAHIDRALAADKLRVGDASPVSYSFVAPEIGAKYGFFQKYGIEIEHDSFNNPSLLHQAMAAGSDDIALGGGTDLAFLVKGSPEIGVAAMAGPPLLFGFVVGADFTGTGPADLKGKSIGVASPGSVPEWLVFQLEKKEGWGRNNVKIVYLGSNTGAQTAALITHQVDAVVSATALGFALAEQKRGRLLFPASEVVTDFLTHVIFASNKLAQNNPDLIHRFLQGWFDTIGFMKTHKDETVAMTRQRTGYDQVVESQEYDIVTPMFLTDGHFPQATLKTLSASFVDLKILDSAPDLSKYVTDRFLPTN